MPLTIGYALMSAVNIPFTGSFRTMLTVTFFCVSFFLFNIYIYIYTGYVYESMILFYLERSFMDDKLKLTELVGLIASTAASS